MELPSHPASRRLNFANDLIEADLVFGVKDLEITDPAVVVNFGTGEVFVKETPRKPIRAMNSTILHNTQIESADCLVVLRLTNKGRANIEGVTGVPGWRLLADLIGDGPSTTGGRPFDPSIPLWTSEQDTVGRVRFDAGALLEGKGAARGIQEFEVKLNLWYAPAGTDCFIHNQHAFIEFHTQVHGIGRMQKFTEQDHTTLYQDVLMSPGYTTPDPFCSLGLAGDYVYPWHQYYADTDCVWLAIEYHPVAT
ncbi:hypothetical protein [Sphaerimonospora thailandensis]|uniref:Uncharacterized protein n=1 Tax=Sphaerimonospora thailandensis TaxID=795644 RepID=A0A8J3W1U4_9ACTN|nr:hypothetical protein [Sphaerimonospora thailandensis]GIH72590.1 hypothetical protein Mth01_48430 [Sphaerimonospora thailandensis]